jgi:hypothetical protein
MWLVFRPHRIPDERRGRINQVSFLWSGDNALYSIYVKAEGYWHILRSSPSAKAEPLAAQCSRFFNLKLRYVALIGRKASSTVSVKSGCSRQAEGLSESSRWSKPGGDHRGARKTGAPRRECQNTPKFTVSATRSRSGLFPLATGGVARLYHRLLSGSPSGCVNDANPTH